MYRGSVSCRVNRERYTFIRCASNHRYRRTSLRISIYVFLCIYTIGCCFSGTTLQQQQRRLLHTVRLPARAVIAPSAMATRAWTPTSCGSCLATRRRRTAYHPTPPGCGALKQHSLSSSNNNCKSGNSRRVDALRVRSWVVASSSSSSGRSASIGNSAAVGVLGVVLLGGPWVPQAHAGFFGFGGESPPTEQVQPSDKPRTRSERIQYRYFPPNPRNGTSLLGSSDSAGTVIDRCSMLSMSLGVWRAQNAEDEGGRRAAAGDSTQAAADVA